MATEVYDLTQEEREQREREAQRMANFFKIFADPTRIRILYALMNAPACVTDLAEALERKQSAVSHQLRILRESRLVQCKREGTAVIYALADDHVRQILSQGRRHIGENIPRKENQDTQQLWPNDGEMGQSL